MLLMIDNYDSFTYNVVQYLGELGARCTWCATMRLPWEILRPWRRRKL